MASVQQVLAEATQQEAEAAQLYKGLAAQATEASAKSLLLALATDEEEHRERLAALSADGLIGQKIPSLEDLRITDFLEETEVTPHATFQEVLVYAAKKEDASWHAYLALAEQAQDHDVAALLNRLAAEEKVHKHRLEKLYDDVIYREN